MVEKCKAGTEIEQGQKMFEKAITGVASRTGRRVVIERWAEKAGCLVYFPMVSIDGERLRGPEIPMEHLADAPLSREVQDWFETLAGRWFRNPDDREYSPEGGPYNDPALN